MLCVSATYAVARCLSVRPSARLSVTFVFSVEMNKRIFNFILPLGSDIILLFQYQTVWRHSDGNPLTRASNASGVGKSRDSRPVSGFIARCQRFDHQVLYTELRRTVASWWQSSLVSGVVCCSRETDDEVFMTRSVNITPKITKRNLIWRIGKSEAALTSNKR